MDILTTTNLVLVLGAALVLAGAFSTLLTTRFGVPLLLAFLGIGMLAGEDGPLGIEFENYRVAWFIGSACLAAILFDGGLRTHLPSVRPALGPGLALAVPGTLVTAGIVAGVAGPLLGLDVRTALLLGAILAATDAAAVLSLVRAGGVELRPRLGRSLEIESGANDPLAIALALVLVEAGTGFAEGITTMVRQALVGAGVGVAGGALAALALNRLRLPGGLPPLASLFRGAVPVLAGLPGGEVLFDLAFVVVFASLLLQGSSVPVAARL